MKKGFTVIEQDRSALLYKRQAPAILAYFYRQTASWDDAEDLLVEVFLSALENQRFRVISEEEQERWLWKVAHNKAADYFRRLKRQASLPLHVETIEAVLADTALTPENRLLRQETYADLDAMLKTLPKIQQDMLELHFVHGLSVKQIAAVFEKNEGAIRMLLFRTLKHLRIIYTKTAR
ncbi:RNA polymerase sigma factor [Ktedonobacter sp. SOSP1-52]|uniref:RNA polymerase sigma factor n=1 Tax=Ktedonobacter sp. SOSP1-52 TaxID=2778366 RepID=UPI001915630F|nr:RNA polymerase sigma factor [Ktedonobacter sp. SOSP1-52]GHO65288.1 RNA polymerase sigma factor [Ktedonobacter sp. SOSP1-52]